MVEVVENCAAQRKERCAAQFEQCNARSTITYNLCEAEYVAMLQKDPIGA